MTGSTRRRSPGQTKTCRDWLNSSPRFKLPVLSKSIIWGNLTHLPPEPRGSICTGRVFRHVIQLTQQEIRLDDRTILWWFGQEVGVTTKHPSGRVSQKVPKKIVRNNKNRKGLKLYKKENERKINNEMERWQRKRKNGGQFIWRLRYRYYKDINS